MTPTGQEPLPPDAQTRRRMAGQRRRDTMPERALRSALHRRGLRFRVDYRAAGARTRIDIAFTAQRLAVFVDGCFWHGCPSHFTEPKSNTSWWLEKIEANRRRDRHSNARLEAAGWRVLRIWEHTKTDEAVDAVLAALGTISSPPAEN